MNARLGKFMREENITAAKLAEILQIQPSSISHLLSGRNKPNFDFIARILKMFPDLNPDWLINGDGSMHRDQNGSAEVNNDREIEYENSVTSDKKYQLDTVKETVTIDTNVMQADLFTAPINDIEQAENVAKDDIGDKPSDNTLRCDVTTQHKQDMVEKIIVFYADQTFSIYNQR